jgi:hypothetical protein
MSYPAKAQAHWFLGASKFQLCWDIEIGTKLAGKGLAELSATPTELMENASANRYHAFSTLNDE